MKDSVPSENLSLVWDLPPTAASQRQWVRSVEGSTGSGLRKTQPPNHQDDVIAKLNKLTLSQSCKSVP